MTDELYAALQALADAGYSYLEIIDACNELLGADTAAADNDQLDP